MEKVRREALTWYATVSIRSRIKSGIGLAPARRRSTAPFHASYELNLPEGVVCRSSSELSHSMTRASCNSLCASAMAPSSHRPTSPRTRRALRDDATRGLDGDEDPSKSATSERIDSRARWRDNPGANAKDCNPLDKMACSSIFAESNERESHSITEAGSLAIAVEGSTLPPGRKLACKGREDLRVDHPEEDNCKRMRLIY
jgi:hypothetical protein